MMSSCRGMRTAARTLELRTSCEGNRITHQPALRAPTQNASQKTIDILFDACLLVKSDSFIAVAGPYVTCKPKMYHGRHNGDGENVCRPSAVTNR